MTDTEVGPTRDAAVGRAASRRGVMCGLAGLGAAGALAACGTAESPGGERSSSSGASSEGASGGEPIAATADVPEGGGIVVDQTVIVQPSADEFLAFSAVCPHQGAIVAAPDADGKIICPRHQSTWSIDGELEQGPAEDGLSEVAITVEDGQISLG